MRTTVILSLGSAQPFLRESRRTQDLWMGSFLLSYLTMRALKPFLSAGSEIIMPDIGRLPLYRLLRAQGDLPGKVTDPPELVALDEIRVANMPTIFTAVVPATNDTVESIAVQARNEVEAALEEIATDVLHALRGVSGLTLPSCDDEWWRAQLASVAERLGLYWGACEWVEDKKRQEIEKYLDLVPAPTSQGALFAQAAGRAMTGQKSVRTFSQPALPPERCTASTDKCSQCRIRPQVRPYGDRVPHGGWMYDTRYTRGTEVVRRKIKLEGRLKRGDRLCAVCLAKRLAWEHHFLPKYGHLLTGRDGSPLGPDDHLLFPSTSSIAVAPFKLDVLEKWSEQRNSVEEFLKLLRAVANTVSNGRAKEKREPDDLLPSAHVPVLLRERERLGHDDVAEQWLRLEGDWLFESSLDEKALGRALGVTQGQGAGVADRDMVALRKCLSHLLPKAATNGDAEARTSVRPPSTYLCILAADGDNMGDWVSGKMHAAGNPGLGVFDERFQSDLAVALRAFATEAANIVHYIGCGVLIYAGGDDILALLPVRDALRTVGELREAYRRWVDHAVLGSAAHRPHMTLSAAVRVMHRSDSLAHAVADTQHLLKNVAKSRLGKNALALSVVRRAGGETITGGKWNSESGESLIDSLQQVVLLSRDRWLSDALLHDLSREELGMSAWSDVTGMRAVVTPELERLVKRHVREPKRAHAAMVVGALCRVLRETLSEGDGIWQQVTDALTVACFLGREG